MSEKLAQLEKLGGSGSSDFCGEDQYVFCNNKNTTVVSGTYSVGVAVRMGTSSDSMVCIINVKNHTSIDLYCGSGYGGKYGIKDGIPTFLGQGVSPANYDCTNYDYVMLTDTNSNTRGFMVVA